MFWPIWRSKGAGHSVVSSAERHYFRSLLEPTVPASENTTINLLVRRDASEVRAELLSRGVRCTDMVDTPQFSSFLLRDLDGNRFYVSQPLSDDAQRRVADAARSDPS